MSELEYLALFLVNNFDINYIIALNNIIITLKLIIKSWVVSIGITEPINALIGGGQSILESNYP
jgi:hypothetical protein